MSRTISAGELAPLIESDSVTVLDVRRRSDIDADPVMLPGARWLNPELVGDWSRTLSNEKEIVIYCVRGGAVSNSLLDQLRAQGHKVRFIDGGIAAWKAAGGRVVGGPQ